MDQDTVWYGGIGLGQADIVLDRDPVPPRQGAQQPHPLFGLLCSGTVAHLSKCWARIRFSKICVKRVWWPGHAPPDQPYGTAFSECPRDVIDALVDATGTGNDVTAVASGSERRLVAEGGGVGPVGRPPPSKSAQVRFLWSTFLSVNGFTSVVV